jgi:hypothetical protein
MTPAAKQAVDTFITTVYEKLTGKGPVQAVSILKSEADSFRTTLPLEGLIQEENELLTSFLIGINISAELIGSALSR